MRSDSASGQVTLDETVVGGPSSLRPTWLDVLTLVGPVMLLVLAYVVNEMPWTPPPALVRVVDAFDAIDQLPAAGKIAVIVAIAVGGGVLSRLRVRTVAVTVADDWVSMTRRRHMKRATHRIERAEMTGAFVDNGELVLLGTDGAELFREKANIDWNDLVYAFYAHGYPWLPHADRHADQYRRRVDDPSTMPVDEDSLLVGRATVLRGADAAGLRQEGARLGVVVRGPNH